MNSFSFDSFGLSAREARQFLSAQGRSESDLLKRFIVPSLFKPSAHYVGLSDRKNVLGRNHEEAERVAGLIAEGAAVDWSEFSYFTNALKPVPADSPDYHRPSSRVVVGPCYVFTYEFDLKESAFFSQQLEWFRWSRKDTNCKVGELYQCLAQFADFTGISVVYSGNKSFHVHCVFDPSIAGSAFNLTDANPWPGFISHWSLLKDDVLRILDPRDGNGDLVEPDASLRNPEAYRRLPLGTRRVDKAGHAFGLPVGSTVPQVIMWEKFRSRAGADTTTLFFRPEPFLAEVAATKRQRNASQSAQVAGSRASSGFSVDELDYIATKLRDQFPGWPQFVRLERDSKGWLARFRNSDLDASPSSVMRDDHRAILLQGRGADLIERPPVLELPLLAMMRLWRDELRRRLLAEAAADEKGDAASNSEEIVLEFETAFDGDPIEGTAHPSEIEFQKSALDRTSARAAAREFFRNAVRKRRVVWAKGPEGGGKSTSIMAQHDHFVDWLREDGKPTLGLYCFTSYDNASEKCEEFNKIHTAGNKVFGVVVESFNHVYRRAAKALDITPITHAEAAQGRFSSLWQAVTKRQPEVMEFFKARHTEVWSAIGDREPVFFSVHDVAHGWRTVSPSRVMWAREFWSRGGDVKDRENKEETELGLLVHDEVSVKNLVEMRRAEVVEWVGRMKSADPDTWDRLRMVLGDMYGSYTDFVANNGLPIIDGKPVAVSFDEARKLALLGEPDMWSEVVINGAGAYPDHGGKPIYSKCVGNRWMVIPRRWWRGTSLDEADFWTAHRTLILTTETLPSAVVQHGDPSVFRKLFSLETPRLPRDTVTALLRKGVTAGNMAKTCNEVRAELEKANPGRPIKIVSNKVSTLRDSKSHTSARGSNQYKGEDILQTMAYMSPAEHEEMLVLNTYMGRDDAVILRHVDVMNQTCGRNLGFRAQNGARHYLLVHPDLFLHVLSEGGLSYSRYDVVAHIDARKRTRLRAKRSK